jgi:hypothetical protein
VSLTTFGEMRGNQFQFVEGVRTASQFCGCLAATRVRFKWVSTVRFLGIEVNDALEMAEQTEV